MRLDDTLTPVPRWTAEAGRSDSSPGAHDRLVAAADAGAWQLEMERAAQDSWHCAATAPGQAATAVEFPQRSAALRPSVADTGSAHRFVAASASGPAHARPYGLDLPALGDGNDRPTHDGSGAGNGLRAATDADRRGGAASVEADLPAERFTRAASNGPAAWSHAATHPAAAPLPRRDEPSVPDRPEATPASASAPDPATTGPTARTSQVLQAGPQQAVRLHVESNGAGQLQAWLGVNRGAAPQAQAVLTALRADARRRGETVSEVHLNGQVLSPADYESLATSADPSTRIRIDDRLPKQRNF